MKISRAFILLFFIVAVMSNRACVSEYLVYEEILIPDTVSFSNDVLPIFTSNCNLNGCHDQGGHIPYLTEEDAYFNLIAYGFVDTTAAETSLLYERLISTTNAMPPDGPLPPAEIEMILVWMQQGARDN